MTYLRRRPVMRARIIAAIAAVVTVVAVFAVPSGAASAPGGVAGQPSCRPAKKCQTPTPTPTVTQTPTPTPTATTTPPGACTNPDVIAEGVSRSYFDAAGKEYSVHNNNWNDTAGGTSTIYACNFDNWYLISDTPDHADMSVQTYPNVHRDYNNAPLTGITSARFAAAGPRCTGCVYNIAFDAWLGSGFTHELMIWTDNWGQRPAGSIVGNTIIGGHDYQVWRSGTGDGGILTYLSTTPQTSGDMPLSAFFADVRSRGWSPTTTWQVDYGVEIVDTNGNPERFDFTDFAITDS